MELACFKQGKWRVKEWPLQRNRGFRVLLFPCRMQSGVRQIRKRG